MEKSYNIYRVNFAFLNPKGETLLALGETNSSIMHVTPQWYKYHSRYTYRGNCKLVGRVTNIRLKSHEQDQTTIRKE